MTNIQPLQNRVKIVNDDGTPTDFFIRWAKQRQIDISAGITAAEAQALIDAWALSRDVNAGIGLSGGGNLSTDITIDLENTAVTPGSYSTADITVDAQGRITAAANGAGGVIFPLIADVTGMPEPQFEIYADGGGIQANITATSYGAGLNGGGIFHSRYARGTRASPTACQSGDITGGYGGRWCYDAGLFHGSSPVSIHFQTTQNQTPSAWGSWLRFLTTPKGSTTRQERGGVTDNGTFWSHDTATYNSALSDQTQPFPDARFVASASVSVSGGSSFAAVGYGAGCTPGFRGGNARGTAAAPSDTQNTDLLCFMGGHGYASGWTAGTKALIGFYAAENWTSTQQGTEINFAVTKNGGTARTEQVKIPNDGGIAIVDGIAAPATLAGWAKLYVDIADGALKVLFGDGTIETIAPITPSLDIEDEGTSVETGVTKINFVGAGVTASNPAPGEVEINVPGGGSSTEWALIDQTGAPIVAAAVTITIASPGVVTLNAHGFAANQAVFFTTTGSLPTGLVAGTTYYVRNPTANTFEVSATVGGASINTTGAQSGIHSVSKAATWTFSAAVANVDIIGLAPYTDLMVVLRLVSASIADQRGLLVSIDNGTSFYSTSGDYIQVPATGVEANQPLATLHSTASTAARSAFAYLPAINSRIGPKAIDLMSRDDTGGRFFVASMDPINAIRIIPGLSGNFTGGSIYIYAR